MAAMIQHLNNHEHRHIVTLEDPIEFLHHDNLCAVSQREVGADTESFQRGLRAALRRTPTSSRSARCATRRRSTSRSRRPRRATW
jgi:Tfp pilus assembly pilus retraction ATPase PilT